MVTMELKVWCDGLPRVVCGVTEATTCQDVVMALASATGRTGRFTLVERWRANERLVAPDESLIDTLQKWGEYAGDVQFTLRYSAGGSRSRRNSGATDGRGGGGDSARSSLSRRRAGGGGGGWVEGAGALRELPNGSERSFSPDHQGALGSRSSSLKKSLTFSGAHAHSISVPKKPHSAGGGERGRKKVAGLGLGAAGSLLDTSVDSADGRSSVMSQSSVSTATTLSPQASLEQHRRRRRHAPSPGPSPSPGPGHGPHTPVSIDGRPADTYPTPPPGHETSTRRRGPPPTYRPRAPPPSHDPRDETPTPTGSLERTRHGRGGPGDHSGSRQHSAPATFSQGSPAHPQASPAHPQGSPAHLPASPAHPQASPAHPQASPAHPQASPARSLGSPSYPHMSPLHPQGSPAHPQHPQGSPLHPQHPQGSRPALGVTILQATANGASKHPRLSPRATQQQQQQHGSHPSGAAHPSRPPVSGPHSPLNPDASPRDPPPHHVRETNNNDLEKRPDAYSSTKVTDDAKVNDLAAISNGFEVKDDWTSRTLSSPEVASGDAAPVHAGSPLRNDSDVKGSFQLRDFQEKVTNNHDVSKEELIRLVNLQIERLAVQESEMKTVASEISFWEEREREMDSKVKAVGSEILKLQEAESEIQTEMDDLEIVSWVEKRDREKQKHQRLETELLAMKAKFKAAQSEIKDYDEKCRDVSEDIRIQREQDSAREAAQKEQDLRTLQEISDLQERIHREMQNHEADQRSVEQLQNEVKSLESDILERKTRIAEQEKDLKEANLDQFVVTPADPLHRSREGRASFDRPPATRTTSASRLASPQRFKEAIATLKDPHGLWV